jgi:hypothetical protein
MHRIGFLLLAVWLVFSCGAAWAASGHLEITLVPDASNPPSPRMGDRLKFLSVIRNTGVRPAEGVVAWISLVQVDPGREQPMDLEDWSAHKAVTEAVVSPGQEVTVEWPMRLIQSGNYRVVVSAVERQASNAVTSPFADFHVRRKPTVESNRILPVALGIPGGILALMGWRRYHRS